MNLKTIPLHKQAIGVFSVLVVFLLAISIIIFFGFQSVEEYNVLLTQNILKRFSLLSDIGQDAGSAEVLINRHVLTSEDERMNMYEKAIQRIYDTNSERLEQFRKLILSEEGSRMLADVMRARERYYMLTDHTLALSRANREIEARRFLDSALHPTYITYQAAVDALSSYLNKKAERVGTKSTDYITEVGIFSHVLIFCSLFIIGGMGFVIVDVSRKMKRDNNRLIDEVAERAKAQNELLHLNRMYAILSGINNAVAHSRNRDALFKRVCDVAVKQGGFRMAWIGLVDEKIARIEPVAFSGVEQDFLSDILFDMQKASGGQNPASLALRERRCVVLNDIEHDEIMTSACVAAFAEECRSFVACPIFVSGKPFGVFGIFAREKDFFHQKETGLLNEIAVEISFAFEAIEREQKRMLMETALRESEEKYRHLFNSVPVGISISDISGKMQAVNPTFELITGLSFEEANTRERESLYVDVKERRNLLDTLRSSGRVSDYEIRYRHGDGSVRYLLVNADIIEIGGRQAILSTSRDITERKKMETAVMESESHLRMVVEASLDAILAVDESANIILFNPAAEELFGYSAREVIGGPMSILLRENSAEAHQERVERFMGRGVGQCGHIGRRMERVFKRKNGDTFTGEVAMEGSRTNGKRMVVVSVHDVTDRKKVEEALRASEAKYKTLFNSASDAIFLMNRTHFLDCNVQTEIIFGCTKNQIIGSTPVEFSPEKQPDGSFSEYAAAMYIEAAFAGEPQRFEWLHTRLDGTPFYAEVSLNRVCIGEEYVLQAFVRDITEPKRIMEELKLFRTLVEHTNDAIEVLDPATGRFLDVNAKSCLDLGYSREEFLTLRVFDIDPNVEESMFPKIMDEMRKSGSLLWNGVHLRKDGTIFPVEVNLKYVQLDRDYLVAVARDITERIKAEEALRESEAKLKSIVEYSTNVFYSHDTNHVLQYLSPQVKDILGYEVEEALIKWTEFTSDNPANEIGYQKTEKAIETGIAQEPYELELIHKTGRKIWIEVREAPVVENGETIAIVGSLTDITERKRMEDRNRRRREVLEALTAGSSMTDILERIARDVETENPEVLCSILLLDEKEKRLLHGAAPSLPDFYNQAVHGIEIGEGVGSCGTAAFTKKRVIVEDVLAHPYWSAYRELTQRANVRSCWSQPFFSSTGDVLGTFALYSREPRCPTEADIESIEEAAGFASLAVERKHSEEELIRLSNAVRRSRDSIVISDMQAKIVDVNEATLKMFGADDKSDLIGKDSFDIIAPEDRERAFEGIKQALEKGYTEAQEYRIVVKDGSVIVMEMIASLMKDSDGNPVGFVGVSRDITERKRMEEQLRTSEEKLRNLVQNTKDVIWETDENFVFTYFSPESYRILGYEPEELVGKTAADFMSPEEIERVGGTIAQIFSSRGYFRFLDNALLHKDGHPVLFETNGSPMFDDQGMFRGYFGMCRDITERKRAEEAVRESEWRFRLVSDTVQDVFWMSRADLSEMIYVSSAYEQIWGRSLAELFQRPESFIESILPEDRVEYELTLKDFHFKNLAYSYEYRIQRPNGEIRWILERGFPVESESPEIKWIAGICTDITERKLAEEIIQYRLEFEHLIAFMSGQFVGSKDFDAALQSSLETIGRFRHADRAYVFLFRENGEIMNNTHEWCADGISPQKENLQDLPSSIFPWWMDKLRKREIIRITDVAKLPPEASEERDILESQDIKSLLVLPLLVGEELTGFIGFDNVRTTSSWSDEDINLLRVAEELISRAIAQQQAEEALQKSEEKFRKLAASAQDAIIMIDDNGNISFWNEAAQRIFGYPSEEIMGKEAHMVLAPQRYFEAYRKGFARFRETGEGPAIGKTSELTAVRKDGVEFPVELSVSALKLKDRWLVIGILRDITERKRTEEELIEAKERAEQADKLKDAFIANMSHEIRTPLNIIMGYTDLFESIWADQFTKEEKMIVERIDHAGKRLMRTVENILNVSSLQTGTYKTMPKILDLVVVADKLMIDMEPFAHEKGLEFSKKYDCAEAFIFADLYCVEQAVGNLLENAIKFTHEGGIFGRVFLEGNEACVEIRDTGIGISEEYLPRLFDAFSQESIGYTRPYQGLGLGMSLVKEYVERNGGRIEVKSEKGIGTTFTLRFPVADVS